MDDADVEQFLAADKTLRGPLSWGTDRKNGTQVGTAAVVVDAIDAGQLVAVVLAVRERQWSFKLTVGGARALEWDLIPEGEVRRHPNGQPRPEGFPGIDRSPIHEHIWIGRRKLSRPVSDLPADCNHRQAFHAFCARANIRGEGAYCPPSASQLILRR